MACRHGDPVLMGFTQWSSAGKLTLLTARRRASRVLIAGIDEIGRSARLRSEDTLHAEMLGFLHLSASRCAARSQQHDNAQAHLAERRWRCARI